MSKESEYKEGVMFMPLRWHERPTYENRGTHIVPHTRPFTILVTGGAGFIGSNLIGRLLDDGYKVISIDNYSTGSKENHHEGAKYYEGDICKLGSDAYVYDSLHNLGCDPSHRNGGIDLIFHLAALSRIQPSFKTPSDTFQTNASGTEKVCEFAREHNCMVIYAGSSSRWHDPYQSPYAAYKHMGEEICKMYRTTYKMSIQIARFYNVYGPGEILDGDWAAVVGIWRRQIRDGQPLTIVGDGEQRRDFTHVDDIVDGLIRIARKMWMTELNKHEVEHEEWELGSGVNYSINEVAQMFKDSAEPRHEVKITHIPDQKGNYRSTLRETDHALTCLDWEPKESLRAYINLLYSEQEILHP
jgi:UDP-glucose 4-epimerase